MSELMQSKGVVILCGGFSSRMNYPKPFLLLREKTFLHSIIETYRKAGIENIAVVLNKDLFDERWSMFLEEIKSLAAIIKNNSPESGRIYSLQLGLHSLGNIDFCFVHNIDNPLISPELISQLWEHRSLLGYTVPVFHGRGGHPVLISKEVIGKISYIQSYNITLKEALQTSKREVLETDDESVLININTKTDYDFFVQAHNAELIC